MHTSVNLNSERESYVLETLDISLSRKNKFTSPKEELHNLRLKNHNSLICVNFNINPVRNQFNLLSDIIKNKIDVLMISNTKLDSSFPKGQFQIHVYSEPYSLERNGNNGGILVFTRDDIPTKLTDSQLKIKNFFMELNIRRKNGFRAALIFLNFLKYHMN